MTKVSYVTAKGNTTTSYVKALTEGIVKTVYEPVPKAPLEMSDKMRARIVKAVKPA